jgi:Insertion element 4 transposase N-terminal
MTDAGRGENSMLSSLVDATGIGTLTRLVPRELAEEVLLSLGRTEQRKNKLPARVVVYFVMALALFYGDGYEEVMRKLVSGLDYMGSWKGEW